MKIRSKVQRRCWLFVWAKLSDGVHRQPILLTILHENQFYYAGNYFGSMAKGIFGLLLCIKKKKRLKQSVDFSKDLINLSRRVEK
jgi:hypothetical protein